MQIATAIILVGLSTAVAASSCPTSFNVKWNTSCTNITNAPPNCWIPQPPTTSDSVLFPLGTSAIIDPIGFTFPTLTLNNFFIALGARITMLNGGMQVLNCGIVEGVLELQQGNFIATPTVNYEPDPGQPEGTDCPTVPTGFTPRICGPGTLLINDGGSVSLKGFYASLFVAVNISDGGMLMASENAFLWGNMTSHGNFIGESFYMHGFLYNYGDARIGLLFLDKWSKSFVASPDIVINNYNTIEFSGDIQGAWAYGTGYYLGELNNYGSALFFPSKDVYNQNTVYFNIQNFGNVTFQSRSAAWGGMYNYFGLGITLNSGIFIADSSSVFFDSYISSGGTTVMINGGSFFLGSGAINPGLVALCRRSQRKLPTDYQCYSWGPYGNCYDPYEGAVRAPSICAGECFQTGPTMVDGANDDTVDKLPKEFSTRYSLESSIISGDGTGSIVTTAPIEVLGTVTVRKGGKWHMMAEFQRPPVWGGGKVIVEDGGRLYGGLDSNFVHPGTIEVKKGGLFAIPRHAKVKLSNHTVIIEPEGTFHIDGVLATFKYNEPIRACGEVLGDGKVLTNKDDDLTCPEGI